ncbi:MAG: hypothetical protein QOF37_3134 [Thermoleophilaceae bacterium]|jgi:hypothetical protein|nr:hypothetical protein [Thermoleophilaceae bacterium]
MWVRVIGGLLLGLIGVVWVLQGLDIVKGSGMSGHGFWSVAGIVLLAVAAAVLRPALGARRRRR